MRLRVPMAGLACALLLIAVPFASADQVRADWNHHVNFAQFHTYSWGKVRVNDPFNQRRIENAVNAQLQKKGWKEVPSGGQVTICVTDHVRSEKQLETYYNDMGSGWGMGWGWGGWGWGGMGPGGFGESTTKTKQVPVDHMVIDMFNAQNKKLLWRGISRGEVHNNPNKNRKMISQDVGKLLYSFPPKSK